MSLFVLCLGLLFARSFAGETAFVSLMSSVEDIVAAQRHVRVPKMLPQTLVNLVPHRQDMLYGHTYQNSMKKLLEHVYKLAQTPYSRFPELFTLHPTIQTGFDRHADNFFAGGTAQTLYSIQYEGVNYLLAPSSRYSWVGEPQGTRLLLIWKWSTHSLDLICVSKSTRGLFVNIEYRLPRYDVIKEDRGHRRMLILAVSKEQESSMLDVHPHIIVDQPEQPHRASQASIIDLTSSPSSS